MSVPEAASITIDRLDAAGARDALPALVEITRAVTAAGASVGFMHHTTPAELAAFWLGVTEGVSSGSVLLLVAREKGEVLGTAQLHLVSRPNQPHRAEVAKVLVHPREQRRGLGERLMREIEDLARANGRDLLCLDTDRAGPAYRLYARLGWREVGTIPRFALMPDGRDCDATFFYKSLA